ncbi:hypothetical protein JB92DRAFT_3117436 [Gautieria morchelliformis]|nr:hypothetical protein JB92DRAFT_3117436 [Gautieria morchelliformis]
MSRFHQECAQPRVDIDPCYAYRDHAHFPGEPDDLGLFPLQGAGTSVGNNTAPHSFDIQEASRWQFEDAFEQGSGSGVHPSPTVLAQDTQLLPTEQQCHACRRIIWLNGTSGRHGCFDRTVIEGVAVELLSNKTLVGEQFHCDPLNYGAVETAMSARGAVQPYDELMTEPNVPVHTYMPYAINSAHLPGSNEDIVDEEAYQSTSNYDLNNTYYDGGNAWNTTYISPAGTAALAQSDASPRHHPARQTTVCSRPPRRRVRPEWLLNPINMIANAGSKCNYISPEGVLCSVTQRTGGNLAKHWLSHAMREIVRIEEGQMEMSQATIINTEGCQQIQDTLPTLPVPEASLVLRIPLLSYEVAKQVAHEQMAELIQYDQEMSVQVWVAIDHRYDDGTL